MTDFLLKEDGFFLLKEDGFKLIINRGGDTSISTSLDLQFNQPSSLGVRESPQLNFEFKRNISVNMK